MKKMIALLGVSVLLSSSTVLAASSPSAQSVLASKGFSNTMDVKTAADRGMSSAEYYNNIVATTPGLEKAMPVGQGGKIIINGVVTNLTATLGKVSTSVVSDATAQASALGGKLLNVLNVDFPGAKFNVATINFYLNGLEAGKNVVVKQYVDGVWTDVEVVEVRLDHVVLNLTGYGAVAFVELP